MKRIFVTIGILFLSARGLAQQAPLSHFVTGTLTTVGDVLRINTVGMGTLLGVLNSGPGDTFIVEGSLDGTTYTYRVPLILDKDPGTVDVPNQVSSGGVLLPSSGSIAYQFRANISGLVSVQLRKTVGTTAKSWTLSVAPQSAEPYIVSEIRVPNATADLGQTADALRVAVTSTLPAFAATPTVNLGTLNGAALAANQTTGNTSLASIDTKLTAPLAVTGPLTDTQLRATALPISAAALPLPAGAATSTNQATGNASLASIDTKLTAPLSVTATNTAFGISGTLPAFAATPTMNLGTLNGAATAANQTTANTSLSSLDTKTPALGQATMTASRPVAIASNQSAIPVTGPLTDTQLRATALPVSGSLDRVWALGSLSDTVAVVQPEGTNLHVVCDSGCVSGGAGGAQDINIVSVNGVVVDTLPVSLASVPTHAVTGPLTDTQLRASAVPMSLATVPTHAVTQSGTWTSGRTWTLASATDAVATVQGQSTRTAGTLTSTTCPGTGCVSVVTTNYSVATVTLNGTYSLTPVFEFSDDGTNFYSTTCTRSDSAVQETGGGALVNTLRAWDCGVFSSTSFRVRATTFVSGTANVGITLSSAPIEPAATVAAVGSTAKGAQPTTAVPSQDLKDSGRTAVTLSYTTAAPTTTDTVVSALIKNSNGTAAAGATSITAAAGKTFRLTSFNAQIRATAASLPWALVILHMSNTTTCSAASSVVMYIAQGGTAAAIGNVGQFASQAPDGFELVSGGSFCISVSGNVTTNVLTFSAQGFEY